MKNKRSSIAYFMASLFVALVVSVAASCYAQESAPSSEDIPITFNADGTATMKASDLKKLSRHMVALEAENLKLSQLAYSLMQRLEKIVNPRCV